MEVHSLHGWGTPSLSGEICCAVGALPASPLMAVGTAMGLLVSRSFSSRLGSGAFAFNPVFSHETETLPCTSTVVRCSRRDRAVDTTDPFFPPVAPKAYSDTIQMHSVTQPAYNYANVCSFSLTQCPVFFQLLFWKFSASCGSAI